MEDSKSVMSELYSVMQLYTYCGHILLMFQFLVLMYYCLFFGIVVSDAVMFMDELNVDMILD